MMFELISQWYSVQFFELFFSLDLLKASALNFLVPVIFVILGLGDQPTSPLIFAPSADLGWSSRLWGSEEGVQLALLGHILDVNVMTRYSFARVRRYKSKQKYCRIAYCFGSRKCFQTHCLLIILKNCI